MLLKIEEISPVEIAFKIVLKDETLSGIVT